jgi:hypothetical protein
MVTAASRRTARTISGAVQYLALLAVAALAGLTTAKGGHDLGLLGNRPSACKKLKRSHIISEVLGLRTY